MIISSIHDTDVQLKYDQVKKVINRPGFYKEESGRVIFPIFFFFFVRSRPKVELGLVRLMKSSTFGLSLDFAFFCYCQLNAFFAS